MTALVDYNMGNLRSVINAFAKIGSPIEVVKDPEKLKGYDKVILPGVGAFKDAMQSLNSRGMNEAIVEFASSGKPLLGICLGMQMLLDESEEFQNTKGLGLISGKVIKLPVQNSSYEKLPHVSWNEIKKQNINWNDTILDKVEQQSDMYFVHSFIVFSVSI